MENPTENIIKDIIIEIPTEILSLNIFNLSSKKYDKETGINPINEAITPEEPRTLSVEAYSKLITEFTNGKRSINNI